MTVFVLIRFYQLQKQMRAAELKVPRVDLFVAQARLSDEPP